MRRWAGLKPDGWKSDVVKGKLVGPDAERPDKNAAQRVLNEWNNDSLETIEAVRRWTTNNWIAFIGATSQNPRRLWTRRSSIKRPPTWSATCSPRWART